LGLALERGARLETSAAGPACAAGACAWKWRALVDTETVVGVIEVDAGTGAVSYAPNDGRGDRLGIDAFLERKVDQKKGHSAVEGLPVVKAFCKKLKAQRLGCITYVDAWPSEEGCTPSSSLESSCWMSVYVGEVHPTHATRFGTFLVAPRTFRVVGAS